MPATDRVLIPFIASKGLASGSRASATDHFILDYLQLLHSQIIPASSCCKMKLIGFLGMLGADRASCQSQQLASSSFTTVPLHDRFPAVD
jgi:hypothetical protein